MDDFDATLPAVADDFANDLDAARRADADDWGAERYVDDMRRVFTAFELSDRVHFTLFAH